MRMQLKGCCLVFAMLIPQMMVSQAAEIRIGLYYGKEVESFVFSTVEGEYLLLGDGRQVAVIRSGTMFHVERAGDKMAVNDTTQSYGIFSNLEFRGISSGNIFQIRSVFPALKSKESEGDLKAAVYIDEVIRLVNRLDLEDYIPGTVESEGGSGALPEYYKAQAVIARTYAIKNFHRHAHEGFNLCDGVHCQAFNGKSRMNKQIVDATIQTIGEILVDPTGMPVVTPYHANCGGATGSASLEWNRDLPHLMPLNDPFCDKSLQRNWNKSVPLETWIQYLEKEGYTREHEKLFKDSTISRRKYLDQENQQLLMKDIREEFGLKSSFFKIEEADGKIVITGRGYGHGLGLCQEGAMEMARKGFTYIDILMFYFRNLTLKKA